MTAGRPGGRLPTVAVVGLGPAGPEWLPAPATAAMLGAAHCFLRTTRHPAVAALQQALEAAGRPEATSFDSVYDQAESFDAVYETIVDRLVEVATAAAARGTGPEPDVCLGVPGSPLVAERVVALLRDRSEVALDIVPAPSFVDLAWLRLGLDPLRAGVRLVDAADLASFGCGEPGPLLVAQCYERQVLSEVKLTVADWLERADVPPPDGVILHHLGLPDEQVVSVPWHEVDQVVEADHLTSLFVPALPSVRSEAARLEELVRTLRARCPWDRRQTHRSLVPYLVEEAYELIDAIGALDPPDPAMVSADGSTGAERDAAAEAVGVGDRCRPAKGDDEAGEPIGGAQALGRSTAVDHLEEELGDVAFQVFFHARLAAEQGWFTIDDVLRAVHDKLVGRHPHVFGGPPAATADEVAARWEERKREEKGRVGLFEGIPDALPALALAAKIWRRAEGAGLAPTAGGPDVVERLTRLLGAPRTGSDLEGLIGQLLLDVVAAACGLGVDPELALRSAAIELRERVSAEFPSRPVSGR